MRGVNLGRRGRGALFSPVCDPRPRRVKSDLVAEYLSALPHRGCSPLFTTSTVISTATPWDGKQPRDYEIRRGDEWPGKDLGTRVCRMCLCRERARGVLQGLRALTVMGFPSRHVNLSCTPSLPLVHSGLWFQPVLRRMRSVLPLGESRVPKTDFPWGWEGQCRSSSEFGGRSRITIPGPPLPPV